MEYVKICFGALRKTSGYIQQLKAINMDTIEKVNHLIAEYNKAGGKTDGGEFSKLNQTYQ